MDMDVDKSIIDLNVQYTLPVLTHSVGLATRAVTAWFGEQARFVPDYGGVVEIPNSFVKNNGLGTGLPLKCDTDFKHRIPIFENKELIPRLFEPPPNNCLIATRYLDYHNHQDFSTITALGPNLYINSMKLQECDDNAIQKFVPKLYSQTHYTDHIINLKHNENLNDHLILMYEKGVKIAQLNKSLKIFDDCDMSDTDVQDQVGQPLVIKFSMSEKTSNIVKDTSLNQFNKTILGVAVENKSSHEIKFYDIQKSMGSYHKISWQCNESQAWPAVLPVGRQKNRLFISKITPTDEIRQLSNIPGHLVNMLMMTNYSAVLVDPRLDKIATRYIEKSKLNNFYPTEKFYTFEFSCHNDYQFYCCTDTFIRVVDTRYPGSAVNQLNHMLDINEDTRTKMAVIPLHRIEENLETLCISIPDRLCLMTFQQDCASQIINPKSKHQPWHEANNSDIIDQLRRLYGLAILTGQSSISEESLFHVVQTTDKGCISIRRFVAKSKDDEVQVDQDDMMSDEIIWNTLNDNVLSSDCIYTQADTTSLNGSNYRRKRELSPPDFQDLDILDATYAQRLKSDLESSRANELFQKMVEKIKPDNH